MVMGAPLKTDVIMHIMNYAYMYTIIIIIIIIITTIMINISL